MQFESDKKKSLQVTIHGKRQKPISHLANILYRMPPLGMCTIDEAEALVEERLAILRCFDEANPQGFASEDFSLTSEGVRSRIHNVNSKLTYLGSNEDNRALYGNNFYDCGQLKINSASQQAKERDTISHYLLRLYCCQNPELQKWFIWHETKLYEFRLRELQRLNEFNSFVDSNFNYEKVDNLFDPSDRSDPVNLWFQSKAGAVPANFVLYRFPFEAALNVVASRAAYLRDGYVFVSGYELIRVLVTQYRGEMSKALSLMALNLSQHEEAAILTDMCANVYHNVVTVADNNKKAAAAEGKREKVTPDMVDSLSKLFPPCMKATHIILRKKHHLKHYGRIHYSLFLKSLGMSLDDAIKFFKQEFTKAMTPEQFQKEHVYNLRYNYGLEGKKRDLSAFGCAKIINANPPGPEDSHGCPFKHFDVKRLRELLRTYKIADEEVDSIISVAKERNYMGACTKLFCSFNTNCGTTAQDASIYHPNQFFVETKRLYAHRLANPFASSQVKSEKNASVPATETELNTETVPSSLKSDPVEIEADETVAEKKETDAPEQVESAGDNDAVEMETEPPANSPQQETVDS